MEVNVSTFRRDLATFADRIQLDGEPIVVTSHGRPLFVAVPVGASVPAPDEVEPPLDAEERRALRRLLRFLG